MKDTRKIKEECLKSLKAANDIAEDDTEAAHVMSDDAICRLLIKLGYRDVIEEYRKVPKWYS